MIDNGLQVPWVPLAYAVGWLLGFMFARSKWKGK